MSIQKIHLNKLLKLLYLSEKSLISELRKDIREEINKKAGISTGGGNFYSPFWHDAKLHISGQGDIAQLTEERIKKNERRKNLYPRLRDGLEQMWTRGDNQEVELLETNPKGSMQIDEEGLTIKVENLMGLAIDRQERLVYPYWFPAPPITEEAARIGLYVISLALPKEQAANTRLYDVMRATYFATYSSPLHGDEHALLMTKFRYIRALREKLKIEY